MKIAKQTRTDTGRKSRLHYIDFVENDGKRHRLAAFESYRKSDALAEKLRELLTLAYQSKKPAADLLAWFEGQPERIQKTLTGWGLLPETEAPAVVKTITEQIEDYKTSLETRRKSESHVAGTINRIKTVSAFCGWQTVADITAFGVEEFIQNRQAAVSGTTLNNYITAAKMFVAWLRKHRRIGDNPLKDVLETVEAELTPRGVLNPEQFQTLIEKTFSSERESYDVRDKKLNYPMNGPARAVLYMVAGLTGYRRGELMAIRWADVRLDAITPAILLDASKTKGGKDAAQPLTHALAKMLTIWRQIQNPTQDAPLFPTFNRHARPSEWVRDDLEAAGLPTKDAEGRKIDFHSLRVSYISFLANSNTPMKITQRLARHSTPVLTMNIYAKVFPEQERAALACLPGADFAANIFSLVGQRHAEPVKSADANDDIIQRQRHVNGDYSGQFEGLSTKAEEGRKSPILSEKLGILEMGRAGVEPATHGFSVRCSTN